MVSKAYCPHCSSYVEFDTVRKKRITELDGKRYRYDAKQAICRRCGGDATFPPYQEANGLAFNEAVRTANELIPLDIVREIPKRYCIGKRPLSLVLGWGEHTYSQIMDGQAPTKKHSDLLKTVYEDPMRYRSILEENKDRISPRSFSKSIAAVDALIKNDFPDAFRLYELGRTFIVLSHGDITPMAMQKLVYYTQGFSRALIGSFIIEQMPKAWAAGPVYGQLWHQFHGNSQDYLEYGEAGDYSSPFTSKEDALISAIHEFFGCYSGAALSSMTHREAPWLNARKRAGVQAGEWCSEGITASDMEEFFASAVRKHDIRRFEDIGAYAKAAFNNIAR